MQQTSTTELPAGPSSERLDSWKDIAAYLQREVRTVQLWEKNEGLPVHRHAHLKRGTVYAYKSELDAWWRSRSAALTGQSPPVPAPEPARRWRYAPIPIAAGVFLLGAILWLAPVERPSARNREPEVVPLTSDPGSEMGATFSPDGSQVAFAWRREGRPDFDIYVKVVGSSDALQLTSTPDWDVSPAWSPDGRHIAFHRTGSRGECGIYVVSPIGGPERLLSELTGSGRQTPGCVKYCGCWSINPKLSSAQFSWSPDGKWLAHAGVSLISLDTGEERRLTAPADGGADAYPAFSPDGKSLAFVRIANSAEHELYVVSAGGGEPRRLASPGRLIFGLCWTADGREIVASSGESEFSDAALWRVPLSGAQPRRVVEAREQAWLPAISHEGRRLAFTRRTSDTNIWQVHLGGASNQPVRSRLIASTWVDAVPAFSPDGRLITFTSDRTGTQQVWVGERDGSNARQLTFFDAPGAGLGTWSPDGSRIAFNSQANGNHDVYTVAINGEPPRQLTTDTTQEVSPTWSKDGQWVYFASTRTGRHEIYKMPVEGGIAVQVTRNGGQRPVESPDGKFVYYEKGPTFPYEFEPWRVPVDGGEESPVVKGPITRWALVNDGLYFYRLQQDGESAGTWWLVFYDFATATEKVVSALVEGVPLLGHRPAVSPDRQTILYGQVDRNDTDLMLVEGFQ